MSVFNLGEIGLESAQDENVAIVELDMEFNGEQFLAVGSSKRAQGDSRNPGLGFKLALARALAVMSNKVLESEGYVVEDESE